MGNKMDRRKLVMLLGGLAGTGAAATLVARADQVAQPAPTSSLQKLPWPYKPIDPDAAAQRAFEGYYKSECMYGAFEAIVGPVAEQLGSPYKDFPFLMFKYGGGGVKGWATLCGALNGAAAAIQLLSPDPDPLVNALFEWYEHEPLPDVHPKGAKFVEIRSVAGSPLCHQSIANWTKVSHKHAYCPERSERCGALTASVARQVVILLNSQSAGKPVAFALPKQTQSCQSCHEKGGAVENIRTKMDCGGCHAPLMGKHPGIS
ncbi:MAG: C-GCAxxG-C-C family protein [Acidobacteriia bacterium]|nr:C-GCAxxG-C-C family protein [Terriglobia bacterium]